MDLTVWGVVLAGVISFVSPCVLPLVPPYLAYMAGTTVDQLATEDRNRAVFVRVVLSALTFVLGFTTVFVALGVGATSISNFLLSNKRLFEIIAGLVIIVMGLHFLGVLRIGFLYREARIHVERKPAGLLGAYVIGLAFAFGWSPCIGPILGAVLATAAREETVWRGAGLLLFYSLGLGIPFLIAATFAGPFLMFMYRFRKYLGHVEKAMGILLIVTGFVFVFGFLSEFSNWMFQEFEFFQTIG